MVGQNIFAKGRTSILTSLDRITANVTDFIRGNPLVSTAAIGIGTTGLIAGVAAVRKIRKKKARKRTTVKIRKRKRTTVKRRKIRKRVTHSSPRHKGHKRVSFTTASGKRVNFLVRKKKSPTHRKLRRKTR